jgi:hypothetical protein
MYQILPQQAEGFLDQQGLSENRRIRIRQVSANLVRGQLKAAPAQIADEVC